MLGRAVLSFSDILADPPYRVVNEVGALVVMPLHNLGLFIEDRFAVLPELGVIRGGDFL